VPERPGAAGAASCRAGPRGVTGARPSSCSTRRRGAASACRPTWSPRRASWPRSTPIPACRPSGSGASGSRTWRSTHSTSRGPSTRRPGPTAAPSIRSITPLRRDGGSEDIAREVLILEDRLDTLAHVGGVDRDLLAAHLRRVGGDEEDVVAADGPVLRVDGRPFDNRKEVPLHALPGHVGTVDGPAARDLVDLVDEDDARLLDAPDRLLGGSLHVDEPRRLLL